MEARAPGPPGLIDSLRGLGASLLGTVHDRVELLAVELQEEKFRLVQAFVWISAAVFTGMMALTFASLTLVYFFWDSARLTVLGGLAAFYLLALGTIVAAFRRHLARQPRPFATTLQELQDDRACIRKAS